MDFLLPFIDDKNIIRKVRPTPKPVPVQIPTTLPTTSATVTIVKKDRDDETILYTNAAPNTITYNVVTSSPKDGSSQELKGEGQQDLQQFYAGNLFATFL